MEYVPGFVDNGEDLKEVTFKTTKELLKIPFVKRWSKDKEFYRFSISDENLMAEFKNGKEWWVIGNIERPEEVDLPQWKSPKGK